MAKPRTKQQLELENEQLRDRVREVEETLDAIRNGEIDAIVSSGPSGTQVYTLEGADHAFRVMVETMNEGAVTLSADGTILYANRQFARMTGAAPAEISGRRIHDFVSAADYPSLDNIIGVAGALGVSTEMTLLGGPDPGIPVLVSASPIAFDGMEAVTLVLTDLTERKRLDDIVAAEKLSRRILEQAQECIAVCIDGCIVRANRALHRLCGCIPLMQPFDKVLPLTVSGPESFSTDIPQSGKTIRDREARYQRPDGVTFDLILSAGPLTGLQNEILGCVVTLVDVTGVRQAEQRIAGLNRELRQRVQELEAVFDTVPVGLAIAEDPEGRNIRGNPANERMLGLPGGAQLSRRPESVPGPAPYRALRDGLDLAVEELPMQRAVRGERVSSQIIDVLREDGSTVRLLSNASPLLDEQGRPRGAVGAFLDITELSRAQDELRASEERYRELVDMAPDAIAVHRDGKFVFANGAALRLYGAEGFEQLRSNNIVDLMHPDDRAAILSRIARVQAGERTPLQAVRLLRLDGQEVAVEATAAPVIFDGERSVQVMLRDITLRRQAEEALKKSEARFRLLSETAGRLLASEDPQELVNDLCRGVMEHLDCQAFFNFMADGPSGRLRLNACAGIPEEEIPGIEWLDYGAAVCGCVARDRARIVAEDILRTPDARTDLVRSYGIQAYCCHPLKAGDRLFGTLSFGTRTRPRFAPDEVELMRIVADQVSVAMERILVRQDLEEALADAAAGQRTLQALMEHVPEGITIADGPDARIRMVSRHGDELLGGAHAGLTAGDVAGRWRVYREDGETPLDDEDLPLLRAIRSGETVRDAEIVQRNESGKKLVLLCNAAPIRDEAGGIRGAVAAWRDISDRKRMLEALRESEERFRRVFEQSSSGIVLCDFGGRILDVNPGFCRLTGYADRELIGRNILDLTHPEDRERDVASALDVKNGRSEGYRMEKRYIRRDGRVVWVDIGVSALHDERGNIVSALGMVDDITDRKKAEEALHRSKDELEERVRERTAALTLLLGELEKSRDNLRKLAGELVMAEERERKRIAVALHDEIAQTLAAAKMRVDLLRNLAGRDESRPVAEELRSLLVQAIGETRSLMTEISSPVLYEMGLASAVQSLAEKTMELDGIRVSYSCSGDLAGLQSELAVMLYQAAKELVQNVVKHSRARNASIRIEREDLAVRIVVTDDGRGFDFADITLPGQECGFGLFSIRERVESLSGTVQIESASGTGTRVTVTIPAARGPGEEP